MSKCVAEMPTRKLRPQAFFYILLTAQTLLRVILSFLNLGGYFEGHNLKIYDKVKLVEMANLCVPVYEHIRNLREKKIRAGCT